MESTAVEMLVAGYLLDAHADLPERERSILRRRLLRAFRAPLVTVADLDAASARILAELRQDAPAESAFAPGDVLELPDLHDMRWYVVVGAVSYDPAEDEADLRGLEVDVVGADQPGSLAAYQQVVCIPEDVALKQKHLTGASAAQMRSHLLTLLEYDWEQRALREPAKIRQQYAFLTMPAVGVLPVDWRAPAPAAPERTPRYLSILGALTLAGVTDAPDAAARIDQALMATTDAAVQVEAGLALQQVLYRDYGLMFGDVVSIRTHPVERFAVVTGAVAWHGKLQARVQCFYSTAQDLSLSAVYHQYPPADLIRLYGGEEALNKRRQMLDTILAQHEQKAQRSRERQEQLRQFLQHPEQPLAEMLAQRREMTEVFPL